MKTKKAPIIIFLLIFGSIFVFGCSSNQPVINSEEGFMDDEGSQNQSDIDELFGIINENESQQEQPSEDDEVLQLLGIPKQQAERAGVQETSQNDDQLKGEIETLEQKLAAKDSEIDNLKSDVAAKDAEIGKLETTPAQPFTPTSENVNMTGNYQEDYQLALQTYNNRGYKQSIQMFEELLAINSSHSLSDNCRYWIGESYYGLGNYNQAIVEFTKVFSFGKSNKMDDAQLKLGFCYWKLGDTGRAAQEFERLLSDYPDSEYAQKAQEFLSNL